MRLVTRATSTNDVAYRAGAAVFQVDSNECADEGGGAVPTTDTITLTLDEALEMNSVSFFQYRLLVMCGFAYMADALEVSLLSFLSTCVAEDWNLTSAQQATISGMVFIGIVVGTIFWGTFADKYGRKATYFCSCAMILVGGFLSGAAPSYLWLLLYRTIAGFGIGGANVPFDLLAEFLPGSQRGLFLSYIELFWTAGSMYVAAVAWLSLTSVGWRFLAYMAAVPIVVTTLFSAMYLPESPRWLLIKGRKMEAIRVVTEAAAVNGVTMPKFDLRNDEEDGDNDAKYIDLLRDNATRKITLPLWMVWLSFGLGYYSIVLFVSRIYSGNDHSNRDSHGHCSFEYAGIFYNSMFEILSVIASALLVDSWGRIRSQVFFYFLTGVAILLAGLPLPFASLVVVSGMARMAAMSASVITWISTPELYSTEMRTVGHASCAGVSKLGAFLAPYIVISNLSIFSVAVVIAVASFAGALAAFQLPETSGKALGEQVKGDESTERTDSLDSSQSGLSVSGRSQHALLSGVRSSASDPRAAATVDRQTSYVDVVANPMASVEI